jgi:hypothetical protein
MAETKSEFNGEEKRMKMDVHKVQIRTGFSEKDGRYYVEVKSLNNPLFKGRQYMGDPDDAETIFRNLRKKDDIYEYIGGIYKEPSAMSLSKIYADEKKIRDEAKAKEMANQMQQQMGGDEALPSADETPTADETPEESESTGQNIEKTPGLFPRTTKFNSLFAEVKKKFKL